MQRLEKAWNLQGTVCSLELLGSELQGEPRDEVTKRGLGWQAKELGFHLEVR